MSTLGEALSHYGITGSIVGEFDGPLLKIIEFSPSDGTRLKNVQNVLEDVAREIGVSSLRAEVRDNSDNIDFEMPNENMKTIDFLSLLAGSTEVQGALPICLGADVRGNAVWADLAKMPHLLVAGTTGSGKSVGLNTFILSLIEKLPVKDVKFVLIDPKRIEFSIYNNQAYMLAPVIDDNRQAVAMLAYLVDKMEERYRLLQENMCRNIKEYNQKAGHMPYIVCVIDEFADLVSTSPEAEKSVQMLAQKARACGIHLILATQRPSVDVVTGVLKANFPSRLSYKVASSADSRTILDAGGAEDLIGRGDALFLAADGNLKRIHGAFVSDEQISRILSKHRKNIKPIDLSAYEIADKNEAKSVGNKVGKKPKKSWLRRFWDFWSSLRKKDQKLIIGGILWLFHSLSGKKTRR